MIRLLLLKCCLLLTLGLMANQIIVKDIVELNKANKEAQPGDIIILQNGEWKDVTIALNCSGTKEKPISFKAQTAGKVVITGQSKLKLGGSYIIVDGLYFINGFAGRDAVIDFRIDKNQLANNCRVTNCAINDFNNPKRMDENNWVLFYGKNNRLDHCSFLDKKNMGVLLAVILDDERSRENYHSIDSNYFGRRIPLASNGGEIMRVGVSQHCQFISGTTISYNFFEQCDGETEIISIKSCNNIVQGNIFKESQGSVVLRHGDNNHVVANIFLGNDKPATGGVRVINKGQVVESNFFYKCRGTGFRSPLAVMNGIPNSPAHRYVQVTDATIRENYFYECSPMSFGEGSDTERTLPPDKVLFTGNYFHNTRDSIIYRAWDDISGFQFASNTANSALKQSLGNGFKKGRTVGDAEVRSMKPVIEKLYTKTGAAWLAKKTITQPVKPQLISCTTATEVYRQLETPSPVVIKLTGKEYVLDKPFIITKQVQFIGDKTKPIKISTGRIESAFIIDGNGFLQLQNLNIDGSAVNATHFISSSNGGSSNHYNLAIRNCIIKNLDSQNGCQDMFYAYKSIMADSIVMNGNSFINNHANLFMMNEEKDNRGYYNAEKIVIVGNQIVNHTGIVADVYRGGNDESTLGPSFTFSNNKLLQSNATGTPLIKLFGVQQSALQKNNIIDCNKVSVLLQYEDVVRATHLFTNNNIKNAGTVVTNRFVRSLNNSTE